MTLESFGWTANATINRLQITVDEVSRASLTRLNSTEYFRNAAWNSNYIASSTETTIRQLRTQLIENGNLLTSANQKVTRLETANTRLKSNVDNLESTTEQLKLNAANLEAANLQISNDLEKSVLGESIAKLQNTFLRNHAEGLESHVLNSGKSSCQLCGLQFDGSVSARSARLLVCSHSMCTTCTEKEASRIGKATCSTCGFSTELSSAEELPVNIFFNWADSEMTLQRDKAHRIKIISSNGETVTTLQRVSSYKYSCGRQCTGVMKHL